MGVFAVYVVLAMLCATHSSSLFTLAKQEASNEIDDLKLNEIVANMSNDESYCFHCIERHVGFPRLKTLVEKQRIQRERDRSLKHVRTLFNSLSIVNSVIVFLLFGGPRSISFISLVSSFCIFGSIFVEKPTDAVVFESLVILISAIVIFKTFYVIMVQIIRQIILRERKNRWDVSLLLLLLAYVRSNWLCFVFADCKWVSIDLQWEICLRLLWIDCDLNGPMSSYSDAYADAHRLTDRSSPSSSNFVGKIEERSVRRKEICLFAIF